MLTCFICKKLDQAINDPASLFLHIKNSHKIKDISTFQCTFKQCRSTFSSFSSFKRHVGRCVASNPNSERESEPESEPVSEEITDPEMYLYAVDNDVLNFQKEINSAALKLACSLCANTNSPRSETFVTIAAVRKTYVSKIISGMWYHKIYFFQIKRIEIRLKKIQQIYKQRLHYITISNSHSFLTFSLWEHYLLSSQSGKIICKLRVYLIRLSIGFNFTSAHIMYEFIVVFLNCLSMFIAHCSNRSKSRTNTRT